MAEEQIYSDNSVSVTTSRVIIRGTTYALRNITSVKMTYTSVSFVGPVILLLIGAVFASVFYVGDFQDIATLIYSVIFFGIAILWIVKAKATHHVVIASSSGEVRALSSKDKENIQKIVGAINDAIVKYE